MRFKQIIVFILILFACKAYAQSVSDSLNQAKVLINQGKFKQAKILLLNLHQTYSKNLDILWLYGQTAYWAHSYNEFYNAYELAIKQNPENYYLLLDYALKLTENGDINKAFPLLLMYKKFDSKSADLNLSLAKIYYWQGNFDKALLTLSHPIFETEKVGDAKNIREEILLAKALWIKLGGNFLSDDQPLQVFTPKFEIGKHFNAFNYLYATVTMPTFLNTPNLSVAQVFTIGNKIYFHKPSINININVGVANLPSATKTPIGSFELTKTSFKHLQLSVLAAKQPYLTTISSIGTAVLPTSYTVSAAWNNQKTFNGKLIYALDNYTADNNKINNVLGWVFAPTLKAKGLSVRLGYAFSYSNADINRYAPVNSYAQIIANFSETNKFINGIYNPYFTPTHQTIHSALVNIGLKPNSNISLGANANIGFFGSTQNPYFYLDKNSSDEIVVYKGYSEVDFFPMELSGFLMYSFNKKINLKLDYAYLKNNFYTSNNAGLTLSASF